MREKIKIKQAVIVEGKYDKVKLDSIIDGVIIPVHGFSIFTDSQLKEMIANLANRQGIIILTDSDMAGFKIRGFIKGIVPKQTVTDLFIPDIKGKERRKTAPSKEGKLGVEGIDKDLLYKLFKELEYKGEHNEPITKADLFGLGLTGGLDSKAKREKLFKKLGLPERISTNMFLELINSRMTLEELTREVETLD